MTGGSSGGAWNIGWETSNGPGFINGHNDYNYSSQPLAMYSPVSGHPVQHGPLLRRGELLRHGTYLLARPDPLRRISGCWMPRQGGLMGGRRR